MPKGQGNKTGADRNPFRKGTKAGDIGEKAKKSKKKKVTINLPTAYIEPPKEEPMSAVEISYKDALLAVEMEKLAAKGLTDTEIMKALGISRWTFYDKLKQPYFAYSLFKHRGVALTNVENALYKRAVGYTFLEKTTEAKPVKTVDKDGNQSIGYELMTAKIVEKEVPGDVKAQELYLINRDSKNWKRNVEPSQKMPEGFGEIHFQLKRREE